MRVVLVGEGRLVKVAEGWDGRRVVMAHPAGLARAGFTATTLETTATASFEKVEPGWRLVRMALKTIGDIPDIDQAAFVDAANGAKDGCPVSNALKGNVEITVEANLL